jgi:hypothetical protein
LHIFRCRISGSRERKKYESLTLTVMNWTITFRSKYGNRWTVETITVTADTRTEAIRKADKWPGVIIKVERGTGAL